MSQDAVLAVVRAAMMRQVGHLQLSASSPNPCPGPTLAQYDAVVGGCVLKRPSPPGLPPLLLGICCKFTAKVTAKPEPSNPLLGINVIAEARVNASCQA